MRSEAFKRKKLTWVIAATSSANTSADLMSEAREGKSVWLYFVP
jgi:hypothetical protein